MNNVAISKVEQTRYFVVLEQREIEAILAKHVADNAGLTLGDHVEQRVLIRTIDGIGGPRREAQVELIDDHLKRPKEDF